MIKITLGIDGMMCGMCEAHVNAKVRECANVKKVKSSHVKNNTVIVCSDDADLSNIKKGITELGYKITSEKVEPYKSLFSK